MAPVFAALAAVAAALVAFLSARSALRYSETKRHLERYLYEIESELRADLSDANDREIRKIVSYLHAVEENVDKADELGPARQEKLSKVMDYFIFVDAFEKLSDGQKKHIIENIEHQNAFDRVKYVRNLLVHAHEARPSSKTKEKIPH